jgi:hypothetical protein
MPQKPPKAGFEKSQMNTDSTTCSQYYCQEKPQVRCAHARPGIVRQLAADFGISLGLASKLKNCSFFTEHTRFQSQCAMRNWIAEMAIKGGIKARQLREYYENHPPALVRRYARIEYLLSSLHEALANIWSELPDCEKREVLRNVCALPISHSHCQKVLPHGTGVGGAGRSLEKCVQMGSDSEGCALSDGNAKAAKRRKSQK